MFILKDLIKESLKRLKYRLKRLENYLKIFKYTLEDIALNLEAEC